MKHQPKIVKRVNQLKKRKSAPVSRLVYDEESDEESEEHPLKKKRKTRNSEPVMRRKSDEYEEDIGRQESQ